MTDTDRRDRIITGACIECGGELSAGCAHCEGTGREPHLERWFFMSFADGSLPAGTQFLGGCFVQAGSLPAAITLSHALGINPGGEVRVMELPEDAVEDHVPERDRYRLLSRQEIEAQK